MKIPNLRKRIYSNLSISAVLLGIFLSIVYYQSYKKKTSEDETKKVESEINDIKNRTSQIKNKILEAKKYQELWSNISENKKFIGSLKIDDVTSRIDSLAEKYSIEKPAIRMTIPEELGGSLFKRSTVAVTASQGNISFEAVNDLKAIGFISELVRTAPGYIIISNFELRRNKKYTEQDLIKLSSGEPSGAVIARADFYWYIYKPVQNEASQQGARSRLIE